MEVKDLFLHQYMKMKEEWDAHLIEWQILGPPVNSLNDFAHFQIKWNNMGLQLVAFDGDSDLHM